MSYSFTVRAATKSDVIEKVTKEFDRITSVMSIHAKDRVQAVATAEAFLALLPPDPGDQEFIVSMSGSLGWREGDIVTSANVSVAASLLAKVPAG